jgi:drug/metabolite transporter (DMT)-like permease
VKRNRDLGEGPLILSQSLLVFLFGPGISFAIGEDWTRWGLLSGTEIGLVLFWGFGIFTIGASTQILAISKLGSAAMVSVFLPLRLVVALVLSVILVDEHLDGAAQICGAVIVLGVSAAYLWVNRSANVAQRYDRQCERVVPSVSQTERICASRASCRFRHRSGGADD